MGELRSEIPWNAVLCADLGCLSKADAFIAPPAPTGSFAGLSLWLTPSSAEAQVLSSLQQELSSLPGPSTSAPFSPHVTLLSGLGQHADEADAVWDKLQDAIKRTQEREAISLFDCPIIDVVSRGMYFQCVLLHLDIPDELRRLNLDLVQTFHKQDSPPYFPHASLLYGDLTVHQAESHIQHVRNTGWILYDGQLNHVQVGDPNATDRHRLSQLRLEAVELWDTNGPVEDWKRLKGAQLSVLYT